jgi:hypothetical protein
MRRKRTSRSLRGDNRRDRKDAKIANLEFKAWDAALGHVMTLEELKHASEEHVTSFWLAYRMMFMSKSQIMGSLEKFDDESWAALNDGFAKAKEAFQQAIQTIDSVDARIVVAVAALAVKPPPSLRESQMAA